MPYTMVVFDDDAKQAQNLLEQVTSLPQSQAYVAEAITDILELRSRLSACTVDILLMDIRIEGNPIDGIEAVRRFSPPHSPVQTIFVTGFDTYHSSAYRAKPVWFLMKPVKQEELEEAVDAALANLEDRADRTFLVRTATSERAISPVALRYVESNKRTLSFHMGDKTINSTGKLSDVMGQLPGYFVQCHKSFAVNMGFVEELGKTEIVLTTGERVPVSQRRYAEVRSAFLAFVGRVLAGGQQG